MTPIETFSLRPLSVPSGNEPYRSELLQDDRSTGVLLDGRALEAQFRTRTGQALLMLTDDSPYEEQLHVYLLDDRLMLLDALSIGAPYTPGVLRDLRAAGDDRVEFSFAGPDRFRLEVRRRPERFRGMWAGPGVQRKGGWWRERFLDLTRERPST